MEHCHHFGPMLLSPTELLWMGVGGGIVNFNEINEFLFVLNPTNFTYLLQCKAEFHTFFGQSPNFGRTYDIHFKILYKIGYLCNYFIHIEVGIICLSNSI